MSDRTYFCIAGVNTKDVKIIRLVDDQWFNTLIKNVPPEYACAGKGTVNRSIAVQAQGPVASANVATSWSVTQEGMSTVAVNIDNVLHDMDDLVASMGRVYCASSNYDVYLGSLLLGHLRAMHQLPQITVNDVLPRTWIVFLPDHEKFKDTGDDVPGNGALHAYATYVVFISALKKWCAKQANKNALTVFVAAPLCEKTLNAVEKRLARFQHLSV